VCNDRREADIAEKNAAEYSRGISLEKTESDARQGYRQQLGTRHAEADRKMAV